MKARGSKVNRGFALLTGTAVVLCALTASLGAEERANLLKVAATQNDCDRLAGSPFDQQRNGEFAPVNIDDIDQSAVGVCRTAFEIHRQSAFRLSARPGAQQDAGSRSGDERL